MRLSSRIHSLLSADLEHASSGAHRVCACLVFALTVLCGTRAGLAQLKPYEWVDIVIADYIEDATLLDVVAINDDNVIVGTASIDSVTKGWAYHMAEDAFYILPDADANELASGEHRVKGIAPNGTIVGWVRYGGYDIATMWTWGGSSYSVDTTSGHRISDAQYWGITDSGRYICGCTVSTGTSTPSTGKVWDKDSSMSATTLTPYNSVSISNGMSIVAPSPISSTGWLAVGYSETSNGATIVATAWNNSSTPIAVAGATNQKWVARRVSASGKIAGWQYDATNYPTAPWVYKEWDRSGGGWGSANSLSCNYFDGDMTDWNDDDEFVTGKVFHYYISTTRYPNVLDTADWLTIPAAFDPASWRFYGLNNAGIMAGKAEIDANGQQRLIIAVPRDDDNDANPDYRDIYTASPDIDTDDDWLIDKTNVIRPGLFAPGQLNSSSDEITGDIDGVYAVRSIIGTADIDRIFSNESGACDAFHNLLNEWGANENSYSARQHEIVVTMRSFLPEEFTLDEGLERADYDWIPDEGHDEILQDIRDFMRTYARNIDYFQTGNEVFFGTAGQYFINITYQDGMATLSYEDLIQAVPEAGLDEGVNQVLDWLYEMGEAARVGACLSGRPVRIIGPATPYGMAVLALDGDSTATSHMEIPGQSGYVAGESEANRAAYCVKQAVLWADDPDLNLNAITDVHFHFGDFAEATAVAEEFADPSAPSTMWPQPTYIAALEWSPNPLMETGEGNLLDNWWQDQEPISGSALATLLTDNDGQNDPDEPDTWDELIADWLTYDSAYLPTGFVTDGFATVQNYGYRLVLYTPVFQGEDEEADIRLYDMGAFIPNKRDGYGSGEQFGESPFVEMFENAVIANSIDDALNTGWAPHPDPTEEDCP